MNSMEIANVIEDLHRLVVLAQTRSFTQAALRLGVSKASVSMRITELERTVGVPLVRRTTRSVSLTEAGLRFVADAQAAFDSIEQGFVALRDTGDTVRGLVRVTAPVALGRQWLAPLLPAFLQAYPEVRVELHLSDHLARLSHEGFDLAVRHAGSAPDTHVAWELFKTRAVLVASHAYLARHGPIEHPQDLSAHRCLTYLRDGGAARWTFERAGPRKNAERQVVSISGPLKANNSEVLREAALGGAGVTLLPDFSAADALASGALVHLLPAWQSVGDFGARVYAIRPYAHQVPQAVLALVKHLRSARALTPKPVLPRARSQPRGQPGAGRG